MSERSETVPPPSADERTPDAGREGTTTPLCPQCGKPLERITYPSDSYLNRDQWESVRAGDWWCETCPNNGRGRSGAYFWKREVASPVSSPSSPTTQRASNDPAFWVTELREAGWTAAAECFAAALRVCPHGEGSPSACSHCQRAARLASPVPSPTPDAGREGTTTLDDFEEMDDLMDRDELRVLVRSLRRMEAAARQEVERYRRVEPSIRFLWEKRESDNWAWAMVEGAYNLLGLPLGGEPATHRPPGQEQNA